MNTNRMEKTYGCHKHAFDITSQYIAEISMCWIAMLDFELTKKKSYSHYYHSYTMCGIAFIFRMFFIERDFRLDNIYKIQAKTLSCKWNLPNENGNSELVWFQWSIFTVPFILLLFIEIQLMYVSIQIRIFYCRIVHEISPLIFVIGFTFCKML